jgi:hypothetical protein
MHKRVWRIGLLLLVVLVVAACATQPAPPSDTSNVPGFWHGLLHGFIILPSFIISLFTDHRMYGFPNTGRFYDFGFLLGASAFLGGGGAASH